MQTTRYDINFGKIYEANVQYKWEVPKRQRYFRRNSEYVSAGIIPVSRDPTTNEYVIILGYDYKFNVLSAFTSKVNPKIDGNMKHVAARSAYELSAGLINIPPAELHNKKFTTYNIGVVTQGKWYRNICYFVAVNGLSDDKFRESQLRNISRSELIKKFSKIVMIPVSNLIGIDDYSSRSVSDITGKCYEISYETLRHLRDMYMLIHTESNYHHNTYL
jgi:hypothetical protein